MVSKDYETRAEKTQAEINQLKADQAELLHAMEQVFADLKEIEADSRRRDRHLFLLWMPGADRAVYDRIRPLRQEITRFSSKNRQFERKLGIKEKEMDRLVEGAKKSDPKYRAILAEQKNLKKARDSCVRMLELVDKSHQRAIEAASSTATVHLRDEESRSIADRDAEEMSTLVQAVLKHVDNVNKKARPYGRLDVRLVNNLKADFLGRHADHVARVKKFKTAANALLSFDENVQSLLKVIGEREKAVEDERLQYLKNAREQYM